MQKVILFIFCIFFITFKQSHAKDEYFMTLRHDIVNLRQGPSKDYPIKIFYKKKFLPVQVQDTYGNFRKIKDHENNTGWIHISQLSKKKAAIVKENAIVFKKSTLFSRPLVLLNQGKLCLVVKCSEKWCKIKVSGYKGWVEKDYLWGLL